MAKTDQDFSVYQGDQLQYIEYTVYEEGTSDALDISAVTEIELTIYDHAANEAVVEKTLGNSEITVTDAENGVFRADDWDGTEFTSDPRKYTHSVRLTAPDYREVATVGEVTIKDSVFA